MCRLDSKNCDGSCRSLACLDEQGSQSLALPPSSGRPPLNWVEQLHAVRLWEHHIFPLGVAHFGVKSLSTVVRVPSLAQSTTPIRSLPLLGDALVGSALSHEQLRSTAVGHLSTRPVSGVSVAPAWQNIVSP